MAEVIVAQQHARRLVRLLKEYARKLQDIVGEYEKRRDVGTSHARGYSVGDLMLRAQSVRPALLNVTREASGLAEQGDVSDLDRLELRLRLAEVEGLLQALSMM